MQNKAKTNKLDNLLPNLMYFLKLNVICTPSVLGIKKAASDGKSLV